MPFVFVAKSAVSKNQLLTRAVASKVFVETARADVKERSSGFRSVIHYIAKLDKTIPAHGNPADALPRHLCQAPLT
jgi:hypothetical protein